MFAETEYTLILENGKTGIVSGAKGTWSYDAQDKSFKAQKGTWTQHSTKTGQATSPELAGTLVSGTAMQARIPEGHCSGSLEKQ